MHTLCQQHEAITDIIIFHTTLFHLTFDLGTFNCDIK